jgi:MFS family permease
VSLTDDADTTPARARTVLRGLVGPVYLPTIAGTFGLAMLVPVLPLYLSEIGFSLRMTSSVLAGVGLGAAIGGLPAGEIVARFTERRVMVGSLIISAIATALVGITEVAFALIGLRLATGAANIALRLSRQTYVTRRVDTAIRGRAMSLIGGSFRFALLIGPLVGGALVDWLGFTTTFAIAGAITLVGIVPVLRNHESGALTASAGGAAPIGVLATVRRHHRALFRGGMVPLLVMTVREGRFVVLPLIGNELGLGATEIGALVAVSTTADLALFPVSGWIMDRFGRLRSMVPAFGLIASGLVVVGLASTTTGVVIGGGIIGIGNGLSAGSMLTLGSDLAPADAPGPFLAGLAVMQDGGRVLGPVIVGIVGSQLDLGAAAIVLAMIAVAAIGWLVAAVGETGVRS